MKKLVCLVLSLIFLSVAYLPTATYAEQGSEQSYVTKYDIYIDPNSKNDQSSPPFNSFSAVTNDVYDSSSKIIKPTGYAGELIVTCDQIAGRMYCNWNIVLSSQYQISYVNFDMHFQKSGLGTWDTIGRKGITKRGSLTNRQGDHESFYIADWGKGYYRARVSGNITTVSSGVAYMLPQNSNTVPL
ncbi:hypothetical protein [Paenibacillus terrae]|uniref:DUF5626 domain-containing protein n=1 Tax=Paenibacillus terrae TaxID=159743 RepID=A0A0D7X498_9BACL|nr:hypothetical protein [Paenibacillus terrae]KJD46074.1 hypothetical protein QD47_07835 [Paenibacillus terrae]